MLHSKDAMEEAFHHHVPAEMGGLDDRTLAMLTGALNLHKTTVDEIMTPLSDLYSLFMNTQLTKEVRKSILKSGFNRIPIMFSE